jgi:hypothetical protein
LTHLGEEFHHRLFPFQEGAVDFVTGRQSKVHGKSIDSSAAFGNQASPASATPSKFRVDHVTPPGYVGSYHQAEYIAKRDAAMASLATMMGGSIVVVSPGLESDVKQIKPEAQG